MKRTQFSPHQKPDFEKLRLKNLYQLGILHKDSDPLLALLVKQAATVLNIEMAAISFVDHDILHFKAHQGLSSDVAPRSDTFCHYTILHPSRPLVIPDASEIETLKDNCFVKAGLVKSYLGVPLNSPDHGLTIGTLSVLDANPRGFSDAQVKIMQDLAQMIEARLAELCLKKAS